MKKGFFPARLPALLRLFLGEVLPEHRVLTGDVTLVSAQLSRTQAVEDLVPGDAEQPGAQGSFRPVVVTIPVGTSEAEQGLLGDVLCLRIRNRRGAPK